MDKVYVLTVWDNYGPHTIIGVYSTLALAQRSRNNLSYPYDNVHIGEYEVRSEID